MRCCRIIIRGLVQGVGFRYWLQRQAQHLHLRGWVRNLPTGEVEAELCGNAQAVAKCLDLCQAGPSSAEVESLRCQDVPASYARSDFIILS